MMKRFNTASTALSAMLVLALGISGCIKPEAPNAEADILTCEVAKELLFRSPSVSNDKVEIMVNVWTDVTYYKCIGSGTRYH